MTNNKIDKFVKIIQPEIEACLNDQPHENGVPCWVYGRKTDLEDIFREYKVPDDMRDVVASCLSCGNCGASIHRLDTIGRRNKDEELIDNKMKLWESKHHNQFNKFSSFLASFPYLGYEHDLGSEIVKTIKKMPKSNLPEKDWFRARRIESGKKYTKDDMKAPDYKRIAIPEGRFNHFGQSHWYIASSKEAAAKELLEHGETIVWLQHIFINELKDILDLRCQDYRANPEWPVIAMGIIFSGALGEAVNRDAGWKPEYFVPRFIADAAKLAGFKGIVFESDRHNSSNLILFNPETIIYEFKDEPFIFELKDIKKRYDER